MKTVVLHPPRWGRDRTVQVVARPLTEPAMFAVQAALDADGLVVRIERGPAVDIFPTAELRTAEEVRVLRALAAVTDAPLRWHPADNTHHGRTQA